MNNMALDLTGEELIVHSTGSRSMECIPQLPNGWEAFVRQYDFSNLRPSLRISFIRMSITLFSGYLIVGKSRKYLYGPYLWPMTCTMSSYVRQISAFLEKEN